MTVEEAIDLEFCQAVRGGFSSFADAVGDDVSGGEAEEVGRGLVAVFPDGQGRVEVVGRDDVGAVEGGVESAEAEDLGFSATGGGSTHAGFMEAQAGVVPRPEGGGFFIAAEADWRVGGG